MRTLKRAAVALVAAAIGCISNADAQSWPTQRVTLVVPYAAGAASDIVARAIAQRLSELLGQPVVTENVAGAGGITGSVRVAKAAPDFHQVVIGNSGTHAQNQSLYNHPPYNPVTDFAPVVLIGTGAMVLITRNELPANNLPEFISYAKANQAKMQYGSAGPGSAIHLACVLMNAAAGLNVTHVPYRASSAALQDLIRPHRLHVPRRRKRDCADREQDRQGDCRTEDETLADLAKSANGQRARALRFRCQHLVGPLSAKGHACGHRSEASRCDHCND
jgi:tripartite-type tricarboxylate transporter receptor subunit TctC